MSSDRLPGQAPYVRAVIDLTQIRKTQVFALLPVTVAAVLNTGYQYLLALNLIAGDSSGDWRDRTIHSLGIDYQNPSLMGALMAGLVHIVPILVVAVVSAG